MPELDFGYDTIVCMNDSFESSLRKERLNRRDDMLETIRKNYLAIDLLHEKLTALMDKGDFGQVEVDALEQELNATKLPARYKEIGKTFGHFALQDAQTIKALVTKYPGDNNPQLIRSILQFDPIGPVEIVPTKTRFRVYMDNPMDLNRAFLGGDIPTSKGVYEELNISGFFRREFVDGKMCDLCFASNFGEKFSSQQEDLTMGHEEQHAIFGRMRRATYAIDHDGMNPESAILKIHRELAKTLIKESGAGPLHGYNILEKKELPAVMEKFFDISLAIASEKVADEILARVYNDIILDENALKTSRHYAPRFVQDRKKHVHAVLGKISGVKPSNSWFLFMAQKFRIDPEYIGKALQPLNQHLDARIDVGVDVVRELRELNYNASDIAHFLMLEPLESWPKILRRIKAIAKTQSRSQWLRRDEH